ncbi:manganese/zinc/iron transport system permease protein [Lishizhenia tianjinensis]|uniref:Manganese/zinc/iron transport system permease protein n=1 Tax=Lishizhenia tianjinensis TaxID=477690 RepID=A0A1I6YPE6_9FLAO|nr:iron chelate uptake ABC transporter family permease subunit [Lishizhenia tianjinensis]SFT52305.1 manganese/zinc/iron transport system permease protein [Lishizhenia tianjinensis]
MNNLLEFFSFTNPTVRTVVLGTVLIAVCSSIVGTYTYLRKRSLVGDVVAHAIFPGICLGFVLSGSKNPIFLMLGAIAAGWIALVLMDAIVAKTKLKTDTAQAFILTFFFGLGTVFLAYIQKSGSAAQTGLHDFLLGKAANITQFDLAVFGVISLLLILLVLTYYKVFKLISFNEDYAASLGYNVKFYRFLLTTMTVVAVAVGIQAVGVVLMSALLITPAATARLWTHKLQHLMLIAGIFGALSGIFGAYVSYAAVNMPTGPWFVVFLTFFALLSIFIAPKNGILSKLKQKRINANKINRENVLKTFYNLMEHGAEQINTQLILEKRSFVPRVLEATLHKLKHQGLVQRKGNIYSLTEEGMVEAKRVVRLHRLWELYLTKRMNYKEDHIHGLAESMEHIITPEIEKDLLKELDYPTQDPHQSKIPY